MSVGVAYLCIFICVRVDAILSLSVCGYVCIQSTQINTRDHAAAALAAGLDLIKLRTDVNQKVWYKHLCKVCDVHVIGRDVSCEAAPNQLETPMTQSSHRARCPWCSQVASAGLRARVESRVHGSLLIFSACGARLRIGQKEAHHSCREHFVRRRASDRIATFPATPFSRRVPTGAVRPLRTR